MQSADVFLKDGQTYQMGEVLRQPNLAKTLTAIAEQGRDGFYKGWVAQDMLTKLTALGGPYGKADLDAALANYVQPIKSQFKGYDVWECPPNGQGMIALLLLNIMSGIDKFGDDPINVERMHHEIEAGRLAYRDRSLYLADPAFSDVPVGLLNPSYADQVRRLINPDKAQFDLPSSPLPPHKSTVYVSVVDRDRNAWFINTIFHTFGAGLVAPQSGSCFNAVDRVLLFSLAIELLNREVTFAYHYSGLLKKNGKTIMPFGVMGGEYQAFGHMQLLTRMLDYGLDIQQAQDYPRFFPDPFSDVIDIEEPVPEDICVALRAKGHNIRRARVPIGGSQAIRIDEQTGMLIAGSDPKDGMARAIKVRQSLEVNRGLQHTRLGRAPNVQP